MYFIFVLINIYSPANSSRRTTVDITVGAQGEVIGISNELCDILGWNICDKLQTPWQALHPQSLIHDYDLSIRSLIDCYSAMSHDGRFSHTGGSMIFEARDGRWLVAAVDVVIFLKSSRMLSAQLSVVSIDTEMDFRSLELPAPHLFIVPTAQLTGDL